MKFQGFLSRTSRFVLCLTASYALPLYAAPETHAASVTRAALDPSLAPPGPRAAETPGAVGGHLPGQYVELPAPKQPMPLRCVTASRIQPVEVLRTVPRQLTAIPCHHDAHLRLHGSITSTRSPMIERRPVVSRSIYNRVCLRTVGHDPAADHPDRSD